MRAGEKRHLITIQSKTTTTTAGLPTTAWGTFKAGVPAGILQLNSREQASAQAVWPGADVRITIGYVAGTTADMRVVDEAGTVYTILGRPNDIEGRHREIELTCKAGKV